LKSASELPIVLKNCETFNSIDCASNCCAAGTITSIDNVDHSPRQHASPQGTDQKEFKMDELTQNALDKAYQHNIGKLFDTLFAAYVTAFDDLDKTNALSKFSNGVAIVREAKEAAERAL